MRNNLYKVLEFVRLTDKLYNFGRYTIIYIKKFYNRFQNDRTSVDTDQRSGRPSASINPNVINYCA